MKKSTFPISKRIYAGMLMLAAICFASCTIDKTTDVPDPRPEETSEYIQVRASVKSGITTRGEGEGQEKGRKEFEYIKDGAVTAGDFVLTYPQERAPYVTAGDTLYKYNLADVMFGYDGAETTGFVTQTDPASGKKVELKWSKVLLRKLWKTGEPQSAVFYLDNVPDQLNNYGPDEKNKTPDADTHNVVFYTDEAQPGYIANPFVAGIFDDEKGTNDLLWGSTEAYHLAKQVNFQLHHNMSRVKVIIEVKPQEGIDETVDLSHVAEMKITDLHLRPTQFNRTTGNLQLPDDSQKKDFVLVDINSEERSETTNQGTLPWKKISDPASGDAGGNGSVFYETEDFVLPPQMLSDESDRPKLQLIIPRVYAKIPDTDLGDLEGGSKVLYEQALPQNMYKKDEKGNQVGPPMPLGFMKEYVLTIRATIGPPELKLEFAPVYVEDWVDMGEHPISGNQAGIYSVDDFYAFMDTYIASVFSGNTARLEKYGYTTPQTTTDGEALPPKWTIMFWKALKLHLEDETKDDKTDAGINEYIQKGLTTHEKWATLPEKISFPPDCDTDAKKVEYICKSSLPFSFSFNNYTHELTDAEQDAEKQLANASGQIRLYNYITGANEDMPGISTKDDFMAMITAYNNKLSARNSYGAYDNSGEQWIFEFTDSAPDELELDYEQIHQEMTFWRGGNFAISLRGKAVKVTNLPDGAGSIVLKGEEGETLLHAILAGQELEKNSTYQGGIYSVEDVMWLIKAYNWPKRSDEPGTGDPTDPDPDDTYNTCEDMSWVLGLYGRQNGASWIFRFAKTMELYGPDIYASMIPDPENGLPDYSFVAQKLDANGTTVTTTNANGTTSTVYLVKVSDGGTYSYMPANANMKYLFAESATLTGSNSKNSSTGVVTYDIENAITYTNNGNPIYRRYYTRYNQATQKWEFPISKSFEIPYDHLWGKLTSSDPVEVVLMDNVQVTVTGLDAKGYNPSEVLCRGKQGADILLKIMRGQDFLQPESGFETPTDFDALLKAYAAYSSSPTDEAKQTLELYGTYNEAENKWTFPFTPTAEQQIEMEYSKIHGQMTPSEDAGDFAFNFGERTVKVTGLGVEPDEIVLSGSPEDQTLFRAILTQPGQIMSKTEFIWLIKAYNGQRATTFSLPASLFSTPMSSFSTPMRGSYSAPRATVAPLADEPVEGDYSWIFDLFGTKDGSSTWTFVIGSSLQLNGSDVYGQMKPDDSGQKPEYTFSYVQGTGVQVVDGDVEKVQPAQLKLLFTESGEVASKDDLVDLAKTGKENPIVWRFYGQPGSTWTFPITAEEPFDVTYDELWNKLPNLESKFELELKNNITIKITNLPENFRKIECTGEPGAETLKSILLGKYENPTPEIKTEADFKALIAAYNGDPISAEELAIYGAFQNNKWTFHVSAELTDLEIDEIYGKMQPGGSKPNFDFTYDTGGSVTIDSTQVDEAQLRTLLTASGAVNSAADLRALRANNTVTRYLYGSKSGENPATWTFPIKTSIPAATETLKWDDINKQFAGTDNLAFTLATGVTVTVTDLPGGRTLTCSDANGGATILAQILKGKYVPEKGIMNAAEVDDLVAAYATNYNATALEAYGELSDDTWTFTFRSTMELTGTQVYGKMPVGSPDYNFVFDSGVTVKVTVDGESVDAAQLKTLFAASGKITLAGDLTAAKDANEVKRHLYGTQNSDGQWQFPIEGTFDLDYNTCKGLFSGVDMKISSISGTVSISKLPGDRTIENCSAEVLTQILLGTYKPATGEVKADELPKLIDFYNAFNGTDTSDLEAFGTLSGSTWTFKLTAPATLKGEQVYGKMKPTDGKPDYQFEFVGDATVKVDDTQVNEAQLKTLFAENGSVASAGDLTALLANNTVTRYLYGSKSGSTWTFPIQPAAGQSISVEWNAVYKQFEGTDALAFTMERGVTVTVTNLPYEAADVVCGPEEVETLVAILKGTYTPPTPDPDDPDDPDNGGGGQNGGDPDNNGDPDNGDQNGQNNNGDPDNGGGGQNGGDPEPQM